jgi:starch synthase
VAASAERDRLRARYGIPAARIAPIFNPLDVATWRPGDRATARERLGIPVDAGVVAWHGRVEMGKKGLDVLLDAWARVVHEADPAPVLLLLGSGADASLLRERLAAVAGVRWHDEYVTDDDLVRDHLAAADVFAFASREEGMPVAVLEAMACGRPVVTTDAPGIADIFEGGEASGGVVVPRDPAALGGAVRALLADGERAAALGRNARSRAEEAFSLEAVGPALRAFLLGDGPPPP